MGQHVGVAALGQPVEPAEHRVQAPHRGVRGQPEVGDRDALPRPVAGLHLRAVQLDLLAVEPAAERQRRGGLAQAGQRVQHGGGPHLVAVLEVAAADLLQRLEDGVDLRGADRPEVGVPGRAGLVIAAPPVRRERRDLLRRQQRRPGPGRGLGHREPPGLRRGVPVAFLDGELHGAGHGSTSNASA